MARIRMVSQAKLTHTVLTNRTTLEGGIHVPFVVSWKGKLPAGKVYDQPVIQLDVLPTALAAAGVAAQPDWNLDGVDLLPYLTGAEKKAPHETLFWRLGEQWAVRNGDWKLVASRIDGPQPRLYDLSQDLGEKNDLAAQHPDKVAELKAEWDAWNADNVPAKWTPPKNKQRKNKNRPGNQARKQRGAAAAATAAGGN